MKGAMVGNLNMLPERKSFSPYQNVREKSGQTSGKTKVESNGHPGRAPSKAMGNIETRYLNAILSHTQNHFYTAVPSTYNLLYT